MAGRKINVCNVADWSMHAVCCAARSLDYCTVGDSLCRIRFAQLNSVYLLGGGSSLDGGTFGPRHTLPSFSQLLPGPWFRVQPTITSCSWGGGGRFWWQTACYFSEWKVNHDRCQVKGSNFTRFLAMQLYTVPQVLSTSGNGHHVHKLILKQTHLWILLFLVI